MPDSRSPLQGSDAQFCVCGEREGHAGWLICHADRFKAVLEAANVTSGHKNDQRLLVQAGACAQSTPTSEKGMWRKRGDTLLSQCVYLMEQMFMESLNGVLCQVDDEHPRACERCKGLWVDLKALMDRYDAGER